MIAHCRDCVSTEPMCTTCGTVHDVAIEGRYGKAVLRLANAWHADGHPYADEAKRWYLRERHAAFKRITHTDDPRILSAQS